MGIFDFLKKKEKQNPYPTEMHPLAKDAIAQSGLVVVCSALNAGVDEATRIDYPINWHLPNVVAVSSSTMADVPYPVAAYSAVSVHFTNKIFSTSVSDFFFNLL